IIVEQVYVYQSLFVPGLQNQAKGEFVTYSAKKSKIDGSNVQIAIAVYNADHVVLGVNVQGGSYHKMKPDIGRYKELVGQPNGNIMDIQILGYTGTSIPALPGIKEFWLKGVPVIKLDTGKSTDINAGFRI